MGGVRDAIRAFKKVNFPGIANATAFYFLSRHAQNTFSLSLIVSQPRPTCIRNFSCSFSRKELAAAWRFDDTHSASTPRPTYASRNAHLSNCSLAILFFRCTHAPAAALRLFLLRRSVYDRVTGSADSGRRRTSPFVHVLLFPVTQLPSRATRSTLYSARFSESVL